MASEDEESGINVGDVSQTRPIDGKISFAKRFLIHKQVWLYCGAVQVVGKFEGETHFSLVQIYTE